MAVITVHEYIPKADIVFMSAWIPAPPLESLPAIESAECNNIENMIKLDYSVYRNSIEYVLFFIYS